MLDADWCLQSDAVTNSRLQTEAKRQQELAEAERQVHQRKLKKRREVDGRKKAELSRLANELLAQHETEVFVCVAGCGNKKYASRSNIQRHTRKEHPALYKVYDKNKVSDQKRTIAKQAEECESEEEEPEDNGLDEVNEVEEQIAASTPKAKGTGKGRLESGKKKKPAKPAEVRSLFWNAPCPGMRLLGAGPHVPLSYGATVLTPAGFAPALSWLQH